MVYKTEDKELAKHIKGLAGEMLEGQVEYSSEYKNFKDLKKTQLQTLSEVASDFTETFESGNQTRIINQMSECSHLVDIIDGIVMLRRESLFKERRNSK